MTLVHKEHLFKALSPSELERMAEERTQMALRRERRMDELKSGQQPQQAPVIHTANNNGLKRGDSPAAGEQPPSPAFAAAAMSRLNRELSLKEAETAMLRRENDRLKLESTEMRRRLGEAANKEKDELAQENEQLRKVFCNLNIIMCYQ